MTHRPSRTVLLAIAALGLINEGWTSPSRKPIGTSMADLAGESRTLSSKAVDYTELFAVNGAIMMPGTRMLTYYPRNGRTPAYMIGLTGTLSQATSRLTMRSTADVSELDVLAVKKALEDAQDASTDATQAQLELAIINARQGDPAQKLDDAEFTKRIEAASQRTKTAEEHLRSAVAEVRRLGSKPGIVIARWSAAREQSGTLRAGSMFSASGSKKSLSSGFVVMGKIEASMLIFGDDMRSYVKALDGDEKTMFRLLGISSYVLRAKYVAYTSSLDLETAFAASLDLDVKELSSAANFARALDRVKISGYFASVTALENSGMVGPVEWKLEETPVLKYSPVEDKEIADMELPVSDSMTKKNLRWVRLNNDCLLYTSD